MPCPQCKTVMRPLREFVRWWTCPDCLRVYWHDGPSLLSPRDPQRKIGASDQWVQVTPSQLAWAHCIA